MQKFRSVMKGDYQEQFSAERLADAIAFCERDWQHFRGSGGELGADWKVLPHELAAKMQSLRSKQSSSSSSSSASLYTSHRSDARTRAEKAVTAYHVDDDPDTLHQKVTQNQHAAADLYGIKRGSRIPLVVPRTRAPTDKEFAERKVHPGSFVITRPAPNSHWARSSKVLEKLDFWLWQITKVYAPGDTMPSTGKEVSDFIYQSNLFMPERGSKVDKTWRLAWEVTGPKFMRTELEKAKRDRKPATTLKMSPKMEQKMEQAIHKASRRMAAQSKRKVDQSKQSKQSKQPQQPRSSFSALMNSWEDAAKEQAGEVGEKPKVLKSDSKAPLQSFLRPANVVGGGFGRSGTGMVPRFVRSYWDRHLAITA